MQGTIYGQIFTYEPAGMKYTYYAYYHGYPLGVVSGSNIIRSIEENPDRLIPASHRRFLDLYLAEKMQLKQKKIQKNIHIGR